MAPNSTDLDITLDFDSPVLEIIETEVGDRCHCDGHFNPHHEVGGIDTRPVDRAHRRHGGGGRDRVDGAPGP